MMLTVWHAGLLIHVWYMQQRKRSPSPCVASLIEEGGFETVHCLPMAEHMGREKTREDPEPILLEG